MRAGDTVVNKKEAWLSNTPCPQERSFTDLMFKLLKNSKKFRAYRKEKKIEKTLAWKGEAGKISSFITFSKRVTMAKRNPKDMESTKKKKKEILVFWEKKSQFYIL